MKELKDNDHERPFIRILSESKMWGTDIQLIEDYYMFPKGTVFHCEINKLDEDWLPFSAPRAANQLLGMNGPSGNTPQQKQPKMLKCKCGVDFQFNPTTKSKQCPKCIQYRMQEGWKDPFVTAAQSLPFKGGIKHKIDQKARDYWLKEYPDEAGEFYAAEDKKKADKEWEDYLANERPAVKKNRLRQEAMDDFVEEAMNYKSDLKPINRWKAYLEDEAFRSNSKYNELFNRSPGAFKNFFLRRLLDNGQISRQVYYNYMDKWGKKLGEDIRSFEDIHRLSN